MTFGEHLEELRRRVIISLLAFGVSFCVALAFQEPLMRLLMRPYRLAVADLNRSGLAEYMKAEHPPVETPMDAVIEELGKAKTLSPDAMDRLRAARQRELQRERERGPRAVRRPAGGEPRRAVRRLHADLRSRRRSSRRRSCCTRSGRSSRRPHEHEKRTVRRVMPWSLALSSSARLASRCSRTCRSSSC
jgi:hypothetical protein